jgi:uncharacterized protein (DUF111 family)
MHLHLDAVGGVAGDMFIAAVLDAFPDLREPMLEAIRAAGLPAEVTCEIAEHRDHALAGLRFVVDDPHAPPLLPEEGWREATGRREQPHHQAHRQGLAHQHDETPFAQIRDKLLASGLAPEVKQRAIAIFTLLAQVEGEIHGHATEAVSFHELGGWDSIADIVGAAALIAAFPARAGGLDASARARQDQDGARPASVPSRRLRACSRLRVRRRRAAGER